MAVKITKIEQLEERSELVQEVMARKPIWIIRYGTALFFVVIFALLFMSWVVKFPDVVSAPTYITSTSPPVKLVARMSGNLHLITPMNTQLIDGQSIAYLESSVDYKQAIYLFDSINNMTSSTLLETSNSVAFFRKFNKLGSYQALANQFTSSIETYFFEIENTPYAQEIAAIERQIAKNETLLLQKSVQKKLLKEEFELVKKDHNRNTTLLEESVISERDFDESKKILIRSKNAIENSQAEVITIQVGIASLNRNIVQIQAQADKNNIAYRQDVIQSHNELVNQLDKWKQEYVFTSPINGKLQVHEQLEENQFVRSGDHLFSILPPDETTYKAIIQIPSFNSGKIKIGQQVNILLSEYPYEEFGMVEARVQKISNMQKGNYYLIEASIAGAILKSNFEKELDYRPEMQGTAEIITEDLRLIERFFYQIRSAFVNN